MLFEFAKFFESVFVLPPLSRCFSWSGAAYFCRQSAIPADCIAMNRRHGDAER